MSVPPPTDPGRKAWGFLETLPALTPPAGWAPPFQSSFFPLSWPLPHRDGTEELHSVIFTVWLFLASPPSLASFLSSLWIIPGK